MTEPIGPSGRSRYQILAALGVGPARDSYREEIVPKLYSLKVSNFDHLSESKEA